ncbi:hypothetical protein VHEMI00857 [[Torrubiella] hemipterigena]|uniref:Uncharacterized protein n=1 Tax=[Torrubiella] hemipterigena TaxID=1531966 RepID=A0A0A1SRL5_9HYPO|nr:hypothetical protein VHEMI00857 [[Torrubiella] hemipterigena]
MLLYTLLVSLAAVPFTLADDRPFEPNDHDALANSHAIFNSIHSAGRQWGSGLKHNGFAIFPAVIPSGTLLYHGTLSPNPPRGPEWLAFEPEHAEEFASDWLHMADSSQYSIPQQQHGNQKILKRGGPNPGDDDDDDGVRRGYLHTYQARRDLKVLYLDGMSAGKTWYGTLDTSDYILLENKLGSGWKETARAEGLCELATKWGYNGIVRCEAGFELIDCDFGRDFELKHAKRLFLTPDTAGDASSHRRQLIRAIAERYDGVGNHRLRIDYSSVVSGLFFPVNLTNPNPRRPDLHRLSATPLSDLKQIKDYLERVVKNGTSFLIDWQSIADMIVSRYSKRIEMIVSPHTSNITFINEIEWAVLIHVNAASLPSDKSLATARLKALAVENVMEEGLRDCLFHYFHPVLPLQDKWSTSDRLLYLALRRVANDICTVLFRSRKRLIDATGKLEDGRRIVYDNKDAKMVTALAESRADMLKLADRLSWTTWQKVHPCPIGEEMVTVMWPMGTKEDYYSPGCRQLEGTPARFGYWEPEE